MSRLAELSDSLERARSQYDAASAQLAQIQRDVRENRRELRLAKHNVKVGQRTIAQRLVALYTSDQESTLEVVLGAKSLDDMITRIDNAKSVTQADTDVLARGEALPRSGQAQRPSPEARARSAGASRRAACCGEARHRVEDCRAGAALLVAQGRDCATRRSAGRAAAAARGCGPGAFERAARLGDPAGVGDGGRHLGHTPSSDTIIAPPPTHGDVVQYAMSQLGTPYVWAGSAPGGFDCSGLVMWAYAQVGVSLPHSSYGQYGYGVPVSRDQLEPGDLVFFDGLGTSASTSAAVSSCTRRTPATS